MLLIYIIDREMNMKNKKTYAGFFWLPEECSNKVPGNLSILDSGIVYIDIFSFLDYKTIGLGTILHKEEFDFRIVGVVEGVGYVTCDGCQYTHNKLQFPSGISKSTITPCRAILGVSYDKDEDIKFDSFMFSVDALDEWVGISGIISSFDLETRNTVVKYSFPDDIVLDIGDDLKLNITFTCSFSAFPTVNEAKINQRVYFKISSCHEKELDFYIRISNKIVDFLRFATGKAVCMKKVSAKSDTIMTDYGDDHKYQPDILVYDRSIPFSDGEIDVQSADMLFRYNQYTENVGEIIRKWILLYDDVAPVLHLYLSAKCRIYKYLSERFLALMQGLESYHRRISCEKIMDDDKYAELASVLLDACPENNREWLRSKLKYGNELPLSRRIKQLLKPFKVYFGNNEQRESMIRGAVDTRNYFTHYSKDLENKVFKGRALFDLCSKLEKLFELLLLQRLGFSETTMKSIYGSLKHACR